MPRLYDVSPMKKQPVKREKECWNCEGKDECCPKCFVVFCGGEICRNKRCKFHSVRSNKSSADIQNYGTHTIFATTTPVKVLREFRGLTQAQLARKMGITPAAVATAEMRERRGKPSLRFYQKAAAAMKMYVEVKLRDKPLPK